MKKLITFGAATAMLTFAVPASAHGNISCKSGPTSGWQSIEKLKAAIIAQGWKVKKAHPEKDCYEVYGTTPQGERVEAFFHPVTLQKLLVLRRGQVLFIAPGFKH